MNSCHGAFRCLVFSYLPPPTCLALCWLGSGGGAPPPKWEAIAAGFLYWVAGFVYRPNRSLCRGATLRNNSEKCGRDEFLSRYLPMSVFSTFLAPFTCLAFRCVGLVRGRWRRHQHGRQLRPVFPYLVARRKSQASPFMVSSTSSSLGRMATLRNNCEK